MTTDCTPAAIEVLLIEDDPEDAKLIEMALTNGSLNLRITLVEDGDQALTYLWRQGHFATAPTPDLIVLDLHLPRLTGSEVLAEIKQDPLLQRIPIVVLISSADNEPFQPSPDQLICCVPKPTDCDDFARAVRTIEGFWLAAN